MLIRKCAKQMWLNLQLQFCPSKSDASKNGESNTKEKSKKKPFRWNTDMVTNLITCLESFKTKMEYKNVDSDGDRPVRYTALPAYERIWQSCTVELT